MMNLIKPTGIDTFYPGQRIDSGVFNAMNQSINSMAEIMNLYLKSYINVNAEENKMTRVYTLEQVLELIPKERRALGIRVLFRENPTGDWVEIVYIGINLTDENWNSVSNWKESLRPIINGGEW